ncbi:type I-E CRISPR-associated protein Cas7/Cse4/CasC [Streptomyces sp. NPDC020719]|uniref:type I-E CRISPR-associated protein Cas7/Cse4/CasC n=1 Tax=Streptomyces sp. NPDC020719 TaxID=3154896 RepID=UPI0033FB40DA
MALADITADPRLIDTTSQSGDFVVLHTLTTYSGVSLNRDFGNVPKTVQYGDALRMRVSPQCWNRAVREFFRTYAGESAEQAERSRLLPQQTARRLAGLGFPEEDCAVQGALMVAAAGMCVDDSDPARTRAIAYVPGNAPDRLAELAADVWDDTKDARHEMREKIDKAAARRARPAGKSSEASLDDHESDGEDGEAAGRSKAGKGDKEKGLSAPKSIPAQLARRAAAAFAPATAVELAIFGRMLTEVPDGTLYSAAQVAHAFSVDPLATVTDDWTAKDDWQDLGVFGAAGKGTTFLASGTLYRYAALDRRALRTTLARGTSAPEAERLARLGEQLFLTALTYATPSSARSRTGSSALPTLTIAATTDHPLTAAVCFESAIEAPAAVAASERLTGYLRRTQRHTPLLGGICRWLPPAGQPCPPLPATLTLEED